MTTSTLPAGTWNLDPSTTIVATATMFGVASVPANLDIVSGTIEIDDDHQVTNVDIVVDAASYTTGNAKRDDHVRSADFLDAEANGSIAFRAGGVRPSAEGFTADGTVTVKGGTSPLAVSIADVRIDDDPAGSNGSFTASATIDRKAVGVSKMPGLVIGRTVDLEVSATVTRQR